MYLVLTIYSCLLIWLINKIIEPIQHLRSSRDLISKGLHQQSAKQYMSPTFCSTIHQADDQTLCLVLSHEKKGGGEGTTFMYEGQGLNAFGQLWNVAAVILMVMVLLLLLLRRLSGYYLLDPVGGLRSLAGYRCIVEEYLWPVSLDWRKLGNSALDGMNISLVCDAGK